MSAVPGWQPTIIAPLPSEAGEGGERFLPAGATHAGPDSLLRLGPLAVLVFVVGVMSWPALSRASMSSFALVWLVGTLAAAAGVWRWRDTAARRRRERRRQAERLRIAEAALQATRLRLSQHDQAAARRIEGARLLRELHDSVGARLVTVLGLAQQLPREPGALLPESAPAQLDELRRHVEACLLELRLSLDHFDESPGTPLARALADLREHTEPTLNAAGIELTWDVHPEVEDITLGTHTTLQLMRIAQEALANIARHAQSTTRARLYLERVDGETGRHLRMAICDDGHNPGPTPTEFAPTQPPLHSGLGWARLQRQATELGAQLVAGADFSGWTVELVLPLPNGA